MKEHVELCGKQKNASCGGHLEGVPRGAEHLLAALPSPCSPTHPRPSQLGLSQMIVEARSSDAALHHSPSWSNSPFTGLMFIPCVSWPKQVSSCCSSSVVASLQEFDHDGRIHAVSSEQMMLRCVCYLNSAKHLLWALIWGAVNLRFLRLATLMNFSSAAEVTLGLPVPGRSSWEPVSSQRLMFIATELEDTFKFLETFQIYWPSCLKVMMDCRFSLLNWRVLAIIWIRTVVEWAYSLYRTVHQPCLCTTQLMVSNTLRRQEIPQINSWQGKPVNWKPFQVTASWSSLKECQECANNIYIYH